MPIDEAEDDATLDGYTREHQLPSRLAVVEPARRAQVVADITQALGEEPPLPTTVVTDADGRILAAKPGVPTVPRSADGWMRRHEGCKEPCRYAAYLIGWPHDITA